MIEFDIKRFSLGRFVYFSECIPSLISGKIKEIINDPPNTYKIRNDEIIVISYDKKKALFNNAFLDMDVEINFEIRKSSNYSTPKIKHLLTGHEFILYDRIY